MKRSATIFRPVHTRTLVAAGLRVLAVALMCLGMTQTSSAQNGLFIADFNHDGIPDVLAPSMQGTGFTLSFGVVPYGTFASTAVAVPYPAGCAQLYPGNPVVAVGDFNNDGITDIALSCFGQTIGIYVLLGNGDGTFTAKPALTGLGSVILGDFNHDGKLDIVTENGNTSYSLTIKFYAGNGDGTFAAATTTSLNAYTSYGSAVAADLNGDGYPDLVFGNFVGQTNSLDVYGNNQNGTFGVFTSYAYAPNVKIPVGAYPSSLESTILSGNFYGTGLVDLAVGDTGSTPGVFVVKNTSSGSTFSFAAPVKTAVTGLTGAAAGSFTTSYSDLLVATSTSLSVLANNGQGTFGATFAGLTVANSQTLFAAVDANGDGHADVYTVTPTAAGAALTVNTVSGSATATSAPFSLPVGTDALTATWPGNINSSGSTANGSQTVNGLGSATGLTSSPNPSVMAQAVTFNVAVGAATQGTFYPTGTITFMDGTGVLGTRTLSGGTASLATSTLGAGSHAITAVYSGDNIFSGSTSTVVTQVVNSNIPVITWANPAAIVYGTALSGTQLNATATDAGSGAPVAGSFAYTPAAGTVLNAGTQSLSVTFTPANLAAYTVATKTVSIMVTQATPVIAWTPAVASITYGTPLGTQQLNATATGAAGATVAGSFVYTPASGAVLGAGTQNLGVVFTSSNPNYSGGTGSATITVTKATPVLTWPTPANIASGTALSGTQLNATATGVTGAALAGAFVYNPAAGTVLAPGSYSLMTTFTPTDTVDYVTTTKNVGLIVTDFSVITWATPAAIPYGTALSGTQLNATAANSQGNAIAGTFVYTPAAGTVLNAGTQTLSVTFTPTNQSAYTVVTKTVSIVVNQATAVIAWTPAVATISYGTALGAQQLNATATGVTGATVAGSFVYTPASGAVLGVGTQALGVVFTASDPNYLGGTGSASITVTKATLTLAWSTPANIAYGTALSGTQLNATATGVTGATLPGTFVYTPAAGAVLAPGVQTLSVTFTPTDLVDYGTATKTVSLNVSDIALTSFTPNTVQIGAPNTTITITGSGFVANSVAQINGIAIATTYVGPTTLTAVVPSTNFTVAATLALTLKNPTTGGVSGSLPMTVTAPPVTATYVGPTSSSPGSQPSLNLTIPAYPVPLVATFTLSASSLLPSGVTDPNVLFANGLTTFSLPIPANTTQIPAIQLQDGTVAETITVPLVLTAGGVNVTPTGLAPVVITVPPAVPTPTAATLVRSGSQLTVTVDGFSNTRDITSATFTFIPVSGASLSTSQIVAPVGPVFTTYFATPGSLAAGSSFIYTQVFNISGDASSIASVQVTLTNSVGVSATTTVQ